MSYLIAQDPVEVIVGHCYRCKDGIRRWVVVWHKPGRGYTLTWDTVDPRAKDYWRSNGLWEREKSGQAGNMGWQKFSRLALEDVTPNASFSVSGSESAARDSCTRTDK